MPYMDYLGVESISSCAERTITRLNWSPQLCNARGELHGGALMSVLDYSLSAAGRAQRPGYGMATIEMQTQFLSPGKGNLTIEATCLSQDKDLLICRAQAFDQRQRLIASATATLKPVKFKPEPTSLRASA